MADRDAWYGDPDPDGDGPQVPLDVLLSEEYAATRRALIGEQASHEFRPGDGARPDSVPPPVGDRAADGGAGAGEPTVSVAGRTTGDTCHVDVVDRWGNLVSVTPSGGWLQSSPYIPALGFALGTRLQMTWLDEASPSALRPGRRPRTTLTPTLLLRDGVPLLRGRHPGRRPAGPVAAPLPAAHDRRRPRRRNRRSMRPHCTRRSMPGSFWPRNWTPGGAVVEDRLGEDVIAALESRGHVVTRAGDWALGRLSAVTRDPDTGQLSAAANPRGAQGYAVGR